MKIKHLLLGMLAMAAAVACKQDEPVQEPKLDVDKTAVTLEATAGEATFAVTSTQNWVASADADWVSLDPASGAASEKAVTVKVTADDNATTEARTATVTVKAGALTKTVAVTQSAGTGETPENPEKPELAVSDWAIVGSFTGGWNPAEGISLYVLDDNYFVLYGLELEEGAQWKFLQGGSWGGAEVGADRTSVEPNTIQAKGGTNIYVNAAGKYDIYLAADATKYYVMSEGKTPAEATEPSAAEKTYTVTGTIQDANWDNMCAAGLMKEEGGYYVAKNVPFVTAKELYGGADQLEFKVCNTGSWDGAYGLTADAASLLNAEIAVTAGGEKNIAVAAVSGTYDVYFDEANAKVWVMEAGYKPGEKEPVAPAPTEPVTEGVIWENDGTVGAAAWSANPYRFSIEGGDSQNECVAEIPANIWAGMKIAPFCVNVKYAPEATWWQIRVLDGWWTANDESGASDVTPQTAGVVDNGDGTFTFQVDLTKNPDLATLIDTQHLLFAGDGFIINKIYFGDLPTPAPKPDGTEANPYLVASAADLQAVASLLVADATTYFKLTANIDLAGTEWTPIATTETVEDATVIKAIAFDGANYTISNAKDALFSTLCGSVQNLTVDGSAINASNTVGVIANQVKDATIKNVEVKNSSIVSTAGEAGGAVGKLSNGTLENVKVACSVSGTQQLGVLVGRLEKGNVKNCTVTGAINGTTYYIGGLAGLMLGGSVEGCSADVNAETASTAYGRIGGLIGQVEGGSISGSNAAGSVTSKGHYGGAFIGVLAKNVGVTVSKCYATGTVNLPSDVNKSGGAGFIGAVENDGTFVISDCYTTATVTAHRWSSAFLGRMLNNCKVTITNCYTKANCKFTQPANCGALVGDVGTTATLTYSGCVAWNVNELTLFVRPGVETAPEGNYFGVEGTISEKATAFNWDAATWDLSKDDPTLK